MGGDVISKSSTKQHIVLLLQMTIFTTFIEYARPDTFIILLNWGGGANFIYSYLLADHCHYI